MTGGNPFVCRTNETFLHIGDQTVGVTVREVGVVCNKGPVVHRGEGVGNHGYQELAGDHCENRPMNY